MDHLCDADVISCRPSNALLRANGLFEQTAAPFLLVCERPAVTAIILDRWLSNGGIRVPLGVPWEYRKGVREIADSLP